MMRTARDPPMVLQVEIRRWLVSRLSFLSHGIESAGRAQTRCPSPGRPGRTAQAWFH
jgi:hypothetical protein